MVNGVVNGNVRAESGTNATLTISEKGEVRGEIRVPNVIVNGAVDGDIYSEKHIELSAKAEVTGNVYYKVIEMVMGSKVDGQFVHVQNDSEKISAPRSPKSIEKKEDSAVVAKIVS